MNKKEKIHFYINWDFVNYMEFLLTPLIDLGKDYHFTVYYQTQNSIYNLWYMEGGVVSNPILYSTPINNDSIIYVIKAETPYKVV